MIVDAFPYPMLQAPGEGISCPSDVPRTQTAFRLVAPSAGVEPATWWVEAMGA